MKTAMSIFQIFMVALMLGLLSCVFTSPISKSSPIQRVTSHHDDPDFEELLERTLKRLEENGSGNTHERILAVNDAHRQYQNKALRNNGITIDENIIENNLESGIDLFEGDIVLDQKDKELLHGARTTDRDSWKRSNALRSRKYLWESRVIPYAIGPSLRHIRSKVQAAVNILQRDTCLRFYEVSGYPRNKNYIRYEKKAGCNSRIGKIYWKKTSQTISIGRGCENVNTIVHETLHALGFWHEQSRFDRNKHVKILWDNIIEGQEDQFDRYSHGYVDSLNVPYDYESIMHYGRTSFSSNGDPTIVRLDNPEGSLGRDKNGLSKTDQLVLNALYDCTKSPVGHRGFSSWTSWTLCTDNKNCAQVRERFCINAPSKYTKDRYCPGSNAYGIEKAERKCAPSQCKPINADWGRWGKWSDCTVKCGLGTRKRTRKCDDPAEAEFGGKPCRGSAKQSVKCKMGKCSLGYFETQFEGNLGRWKYGYKWFTWQLHNGIMIPGPRRDHTTGKGMYAIARTASLSRGSRQGTAKLVSPVIGAGGPTCMTFFYCIDGKSANTLAVRITLLSNKNSWYLFYARGEKGRDWHLGTALIDVPGEDVQLSFEATATGSRKEGTIAIDDVYFQSGRCSNPPTVKPTTPPCIDVNKNCGWWATIGECEKNPNYMNKYCRKSCICQRVKCKDIDKRCSRWARTGECKKNPGYMKSRCCRSCKALQG